MLEISWIMNGYFLIGEIDPQSKCHSGIITFLDSLFQYLIYICQTIQSSVAIVIGLKNASEY